MVSVQNQNGRTVSLGEAFSDNLRSLLRLIE